MSDDPTQIGCQSQDCPCCAAVLAIEAIAIDPPEAAEAVRTFQAFELVHNPDRIRGPWRCFPHNTGKLVDALATATIRTESEVRAQERARVLGELGPLLRVALRFPSTRARAWLEQAAPDVRAEVEAK